MQALQINARKIQMTGDNQLDVILRMKFLKQLYELLRTDCPA